MDEWIEQYKADRDSGLRSIMQFFISASGCKGKITSQMQSSMEHAAIIRRMTEEFDEVFKELEANVPILILRFFANFHRLLKGKRGISHDYVWSAMEKISKQLL